MNIELHDNVLGDGPDVVLLHGLFGQGSNLGSIARALQTEFRVHSPDLPDHGHSPWTDEPSIASYAEAVGHWMANRDIPRAHVLGHSLGGKVAMELALSYPALVDKLVVADIAPVTYQPSHEGVFEGLFAVSAAQCESRQEAARVLEKTIPDPGVVQFLLLNLRRVGVGQGPGEGVWQWRLNHEGLAAAYPNLLQGIAAVHPFYGETLFIRGDQSAYVTDAHREAIEALFRHAEVATIEGAGHWLHVDKPEQFNQMVMDFLI
ncbi:MAG: alpha/beta fold hydrolase [Halieaceae bacterium]